MTDTLKKIQQALKDDGFYTLKVDGIWGNGSQTALDKAIAAANTGSKPMNIAWGAKVPKEFLQKVVAITGNLGLPAATGPSDLMSCIAWESGCTFSASVKNAAGSGAVGLIQFMPATAIVYFNSADAIAKMNDAQKKAAGLDAVARLGKLTAVEQLDYVEKYFAPYKGKLQNLGDLYMAILWPKGIGKSDDFVLWNKDDRPTTYLQNKGLDVNKDGDITRGECLVKVKGMQTAGLQAGNFYANYA